MPLSNYIEIGKPAASFASTGKGIGGQIVREIPKGTMDGSNTVFTLSYAPTPQWAVWLVVNGDKQNPYPLISPATAPDFTLDGNTITYRVAPMAADWHEIMYLKGPSVGSSGSGMARFFGPGTSGSTAIVGGPGSASSSGSALYSRWGTIVFGVDNPADGDTLTIGSTTYTFKTTINNAVANEIHIGSTLGVTVSNTIGAILADGLYSVSGTDYSSATTPNPDIVIAHNMYGAGNFFDIWALLPSADATIVLSSSVTSAGVIYFLNPKLIGQHLDTMTLANVAMNDGDTLTIGSVTYTFRTTINNATPNEILAAPIAGNFDGGSLQVGIVTIGKMIVAAVDRGYGAGTYYSSATTSNPDVYGYYDSPSDQATFYAKTAGAVTISTLSSSGSFTFAGSTLGTGTGSTAGTGASTDNIDWGTSSDLRLVADMSFGAWIKISSSGLGSIVTNGYAFSSDIAYGLFVTGVSGAWTLTYEHFASGIGGTLYSHEFVTNIPNDKWVYVGFTRDSVAKTVTLYMGYGSDITTVGTYTYAANPGTFGPATHLQIGNYFNGPGGVGYEKNLSGAVEEHYIWNRKLTSDEHADAMSGNPSLTGMLLGCLMGDDPEVDLSGNGASGTVTGTTLVQGHN
jgi:hypothetical protein